LLLLLLLPFGLIPCPEKGNYDDDPFSSERMNLFVDLMVMQILWFYYKVNSFFFTPDDARCC